MEVEHTLSDIFFLAAVAVIAGAYGWEKIEDFGKNNLTWLQQYGDYKTGITVNDILARVISMLNLKLVPIVFYRLDERLSSCD